MVTLHPTTQSKASKRCMEATATEPSTRTLIDHSFSSLPKQAAWQWRTLPRKDMSSSKSPQLWKLNIHISANSFCGNYSFLKVRNVQCSHYGNFLRHWLNRCCGNYQRRKLFKGGNHSRKCCNNKGDRN